MQIVLSPKKSKKKNKKDKKKGRHWKALPLCNWKFWPFRCSRENDAASKLLMLCLDFILAMTAAHWAARKKNIYTSLMKKKTTVKLQLYLQTYRCLSPINQYFTNDFLTLGTLCRAVIQRWRPRCACVSAVRSSSLGFSGSKLQHQETKASGWLRNPAVGRWLIPWSSYYNHSNNNIMVSKNII